MGSLDLQNDSILILILLTGAVNFGGTGGGAQEHSIPELPAFFNFSTRPG